MSKGGGSDDDARAFEQAMSGARPLPGPRRVGGGSQVERGAGARPARAQRPVAAGESVLATDGASGRAADVSARELRALRSGERRPEARLDLHGMTRDQALSAVERFIQQSRAGGLRAVMVIHGRGLNSEASGPVLRPALHSWLGSGAATRAGVMAFAPAPAPWGGPGATLILLRR